MFNDGDKVGEGRDVWQGEGEAPSRSPEALLVSAGVCVGVGSLPNNARVMAGSALCIVPANVASTVISANAESADAVSTDVACTDAVSNDRDSTVSGAGVGEGADLGF